MSTSLNLAEYLPSWRSLPFSADLLILFPFSEKSPFLELPGLPLLFTQSEALKERRDWVLAEAERML